MCVLHIFKEFEGKVHKVSINAEDYIRLKITTFQLKVRYPGSDFVVARLNDGTYMNRAVLNYFGRDMVDHIDRNPLNNCKENLRVATRFENARNRASIRTSKYSKYKGVSYDKSPKTTGFKRWTANIQCGDLKLKKKFHTEREAALQYNEWAKELHGEFAVLNDVE